jgi:uncharacterized protein YegP (UPF0339 family)
LGAVPAASGGIEKEPELATFSIDQARGGFRAHYWSGGRLVWWTEVYERKAGAQNAIDSIKRNAASAPVVDRAKNAA